MLVNYCEKEKTKINIATEARSNRDSMIFTKCVTTFKIILARLKHLHTIRKFDKIYLQASKKTGSGLPILVNKGATGFETIITDSLVNEVASINLSRSFARSEWALLKQRLGLCADKDSTIYDRTTRMIIEQDLVINNNICHSIVAYYKEYFNIYFSKDLYGVHFSDKNTILSSGSICNDSMPLSVCLKYSVYFAMKKNWYGYSNSLGRDSARIAIAEMENQKTDSLIDAENVALIMGVTQGIASIARFIIDFYFNGSGEAICFFPTYIPFCTALSNICKLNIQHLKNHQISFDDFIHAIKEDTRIVFLISEQNPIGRRIENKLLLLICKECAERGIYLIYDDAGDCFSEYKADCILGRYLGSKYFIKIDSFSKKYGVPGMKLGHFIASKHFIKDYYEYASTQYGGPSSFFYLMQEFAARFESFKDAGKRKLSKADLGMFEASSNLTLNFLQLLYSDYLDTSYYNETLIINNRRLCVEFLSSFVPSLVHEVIIPNTGVNMSVVLNTDMDSYSFFLSLLSEKEIAVFPGICSGVYSGCQIRITISVRPDILLNGLYSLIDFLKRHNTREFIRKHAIYKKILVEYGKYETYKDLDFYTHIYDCMEKSKIIYDSLLEKKVDADIVTDLSVLHDAGKVISVILWRIWRILRIEAIKSSQKRKRILKKFRDDELLGYRSALSSGTPISIDELKDKYKDVLIYDDIEKIQERVSPLPDYHYTYMIITKALEGLNRADHVYWTMIRDKLAGIDESKSACIASIIVNIADKIADYPLQRPIKIEHIYDRLEMKRKYAIWRYSKCDGISNVGIKNDFSTARLGIRRIMGVD